MNGPLDREEREALFAGLASPSDEVRRLAVEQVERLPVADAVARLVECLGDPAWRVRKAAIERLAAMGDDALVLPGLRASLADGENPGRRNSAFEVYVAIGARAIPSLVEALECSDVDVRKLAVDALASIGHVSARSALTRALDDADVNVRAAAADALGGVGGVAEVSRLLDVATTPAQAALVRLSALRSLARLQASIGTDRLQEALANPQLRPAALELLGHSTDPVAVSELEKGLVSSIRAERESAIGGWLLQLSRRDGAQADVLVRSVRAIALAERDLVVRCCEGLGGEDLGRRIGLIQLLGLIGDERAVLPLLEATRDVEVEELAEATLVALGGATSAALERSWHALEADLALRACSLLGRIGGPAAERLLTSALAAPDPARSGRAAVALAALRCFERVPELVRRLDAAVRSDDDESSALADQLIAAIVELAEAARSGDESTHVQLIEVLTSRLGGAPTGLRVAIARVLACVGRPEDGDVVEYLMRDASPLVRRAAVPACLRLDPERGRASLRLALLDEFAGVRIEGARTLARAATRDGLEDLSRLSGDGDARVAAAAIRAMGELVERLGEGRERVAERIVGALGREAIVALAALETLAELGGPSVARGATGALSRPEPEVVRAAIVCLARHAEMDALAPLVERLGHEDWSVRAEAVKVLAARRHRRALPALLRRIDCEDDPFVRDALLDATRRLEG